MATDPRDVTLAILAGGAGTRMGGPKSLLHIRGTPILQYLHARLAWPGPTLLVTAPGNQRPPGHDLFTVEATDPTADQGPVRGIHTALTAATTAIVVITTVDMPNVALAHLAYLATELARLDTPGVMLERSAPNPSVEPFPCALTPALLPDLARRLADGRLSARALASTLTLLPAPPAWPAATWLNLNHPEDLAAFEGDPLQ